MINHWKLEKNERFSFDESKVAGPPNGGWPEYHLASLSEIREKDH